MGSSNVKKGYGFTGKSKLEIAYKEHNNTKPLDDTNISLNPKKPSSKISVGKNKLGQV